MSLELTIQENTATLRELISLLKISTTHVVQVTPIDKAEAPAPEPKAPAKRNAKKAASSEQTAPSQDVGAVSASATEDVAAPAAEVTYADLQKVVLAFISKHGKPAAQAIAHEYGLDSFKAADPSQYAELKAVVEAEI